MAPEDLVCASVTVAFCGVDVVNDTDTMMVVDSMVVITDRGRPTVVLKAKRGRYQWCSARRSGTLGEHGSGSEAQQIASAQRPGASPENRLTPS